MGKMLGVEIIGLKRDVEILLKKTICSCVWNNIGMSKGLPRERTYECPRCSVLRRLNELQEKKSKEVQEKKLRM